MFLRGKFSNPSISTHSDGSRTNMKKSCLKRKANDEVDGLCCPSKISKAENSLDGKKTVGTKSNQKVKKKDESEKETILRKSVPKKKIKINSNSRSKEKGSKQEKEVCSKSKSQNFPIDIVETGTKSCVSSFESNDPLALLMMMEGTSHVTNGPIYHDQSSQRERSHKIKGNKLTEERMCDSDDAGELSDWEDVQDHPIADVSSNSQASYKPVEVTLDLPDILKHKKKKRKQFDWKAYFQQKMRKFKKELVINIHKAHLLCLLAHGLRQNDFLNEPTLSAIILSIAPAKLANKNGLAEENQVQNIMTWYKKKFPLNQVSHVSQNCMVSATSMIKAVRSGLIQDARVWVFSSSELSLSSKGKQQEKKKAKPTGPTKSGTSEKNSLKKNSSKGASSSSSYFKRESALVSTNSSSLHSSRKSKEEAKLRSKKNLEEEEDDIFMDTESDSDEEAVKSKSRKKNQKRKRTNDSSKSGSDVKGRPVSHSKRESNRKVVSSSSENEFEPSSDSQNTEKAHDFWLELFVTKKNKWICFDCFRSQLGKPYHLAQCATQPLSYVITFRNDNSVKEVTARYAKQWLSKTRKLQADEDWVSSTFSYFDVSSYNERIIEEDDIKGQLLTLPMPTSISDFKNHPLYALKRHLLKFEAIYPADAIPLGYIKNEPIYARECVRILHSRDNWLKEGRCVRLKEEPYKMVKSRPKWNKPKDNPDELDLETFGEWQTEKYIPPPAVNGKVPKNDYGNVELFQPWMLPQGTVHLQVQGLQRIAKKLGIDVAPAMIGWDYHSGYSHPVMDGWVVCEEFSDTLLNAWDEDQEMHRQREEEKKDKRVYGNWKRLIRGLLIKERLKNKFLQDNALTLATEELNKMQEEDLHDADPALPTGQYWPRNRQEEIEVKEKQRMQQRKNLLNKEKEKMKIEELKLSDDEDKSDCVTSTRQDPSHVSRKKSLSANPKTKSQASNKHEHKMDSKLLTTKSKQDEEMKGSPKTNKKMPKREASPEKTNSKPNQRTKRNRHLEDEKDKTFQPYDKAHKLQMVDSDKKFVSRVTRSRKIKQV